MTSRLALLPIPSRQELILSGDAPPTLGVDTPVGHAYMRRQTAEMLTNDASIGDPQSNTEMNSLTSSPSLTSPTPPFNTRKRSITFGDEHEVQFTKGDTCLRHSDSAIIRKSKEFDGNRSGRPGIKG